ncbi:mandelate racemase/muconate lactonizing enzyme family protein [Chloroflexota bacterium]
MKITGLESRIVAVPTRQSTNTFSLGKGAWRVAIIIELATDKGLTGLGEVVPPFHNIDFEAPKRLIDSSKPLLVGEDAANIELIKKKLYAAYNLAHLHLHAGNWLLNGIEMALWDLLGKECGQPLYKIWGGAFRKKIPYFGFIQRGTPETVARQASELVKRGFKTLYLKIGLDTETDIACVKAIRESAGYGANIKLRVDANQSWSPGEAIRIINRIAEYDIEFVDQPVLMYDLDGLARVSSAVAVPIASHESSWTFYEVLNVIKKEAADIIHIDPRFDAGFTGARISAGIAEAAGLPVVAHSMYELGIAQCAYMHLIASCPNFIYANQTAYDDLLDDVIAGGRLEFKDGGMDLPEKPGIGVELDSRNMARYNSAYEENVKGQEPSHKIPPYRFMSQRRFCQ